MRARLRRWQTLTTLELTVKGRRKTLLRKPHRSPHVTRSEALQVMQRE
ncbi:MAG: hypothetical protein ACYCYO_07560 [Bacilli bacterium]